MKPTHAFVGHAATNSPLRQIFPTGLLPLRSIHPRTAFLGSERLEAKVYLIDLRACDADELERMAQFLTPQFDGLIEAARHHLAEVEEFPVREANITGTSFPLRYAQ